MSRSSNAPENISVLKWNVLLSQVKIKYLSECSSLQLLFRPCPRWVPFWPIFVRKAAPYKQSERCLRGLWISCFSRIWKSLCNVLGAGSNPLFLCVVLLQGKCAEQEQLLSGILQRLVWERMKVWFPSSFQKWGLIELSAAFTQAKDRVRFSEYGSCRRVES